MKSKDYYKKQNCFVSEYPLQYSRKGKRGSEKFKYWGKGEGEKWHERQAGGTKRNGQKKKQQKKGGNKKDEKATSVYAEPDDRSS